MKWSSKECRSRAGCTLGQYSSAATGIRSRCYPMNSTGRYGLIIQRVITGRISLRSRQSDARHPSRISLRAAVTEKIPLLGLSLVEGIATLHAQVGAMDRIDGLTFGGRLANVFNAYFWYLEKTFVPVGLKA